MAITAALVKELREITGAGMMDCKKVLPKLMAIFRKQLTYFVKNGLAAAAKKSRSYCC